jgi:rSAM/selenodomain-associated transferase 2
VKSKAATPELSVIIPTLNEAGTLPALLGDLSAQQGITLEVLISDGGSTDGTPQIAADLLARHNLNGAVSISPAGRGRQLNRGAAQAKGEWLLFLHADSRLPELTALANSLTMLRRDGHPRLAGHFLLHYDLADEERHFGYYLSEVKARLGLPGTIHGDQGFWLARAFFADLGGFREDLPVLEDTLLAEAIRRCGQWRLLPAKLITSPRRFLVEGYRQRQTLNALLMNFALTGWDEPLRRFPAAYACQDRARPLQLAPFYRLVDELLRELSWPARLRVWYRTGQFVRSNAWQLVLRRTASTAFIAGNAAETVPHHPVSRFRAWFEPLSDHPLGHLGAALLTWLWFRTRSRTPVQGA